ncbi:MAG: LysM peptidoglycan-binding domain-containing protein [Microthrixaceae bacterium]|nr:LysM peptidoglycan-binding domain-containing protein [Microthrixaceae bacterium]
MAAVVDYETGSRIAVGAVSPGRTNCFDPKGNDRSHLTLIRSPQRPRRSMQRVFVIRRLFVVSVVISIAALGFVGAKALFSGATDAPSFVSSHIVVSNESLWSIASAAQPDRDPRHTISEIVRLNTDNSGDFDPSAPLSVGQEILIPLG